MIHGNAGRGDSLRVVMDLLEEVQPEALAPMQLEALVMERGLMPDLSDRAIYARIKRALDSLEELGYVEREGHRSKEGVGYRLAAQAVQDDVKRELKEFLLARKNRLPRSDGDFLMAAFEGALSESAEELGLERAPKLGRLARTIKKAPL